MNMPGSITSIIISTCLVCSLDKIRQYKNKILASIRYYVNLGITTCYYAFVVSSRSRQDNR